IATKVAASAATSKGEKEGRRLVRVFAKTTNAVEVDPAGVIEKLRQRPDVPAAELEEFRVLLNVAPPAPPADQASRRPPGPAAPAPVPRESVADPGPAGPPPRRRPRPPRSVPARAALGPGVRGRRRDPGAHRETRVRRSRGPSTWPAPPARATARSAPSRS